MEKTIRVIQKEVDDWANQFKKPYFEQLSMLACLTEEVGEVARVMNDMFGDKKKKNTENMQNLGEELADVLFNVIFLANANNIDLTEAVNNKFDKITNRDKDRFEKK